MQLKLPGQLDAQVSIAASWGVNAGGELYNTDLDQLARHGVDATLLRAMYRCMLRARLFDRKAIALQRTGRLGTYASCYGQEAIGAAAGLALRKEDVFVPSYREQTTQLARGVSIVELLLYWGGDERGSCFAGPRQDMPCAVPIASQCQHAVGIAYAFKLRQQARVALVFCGDGATSQGDFYEAINAAGVWQLPLVFVVCNNQWAISVPRAQQTSTNTLAQKAVAAGLPAAQLDGNDVLASYSGLRNAIEAARSGAGPCLLEAQTYRLGDHTTADDASRYRKADELAAAQRSEPLARLRTFLQRNGIVPEPDFAAIEHELEQKLDKAVQQYLNTPAQAPRSMLDYLFAELPEALLSQAEQLELAAASSTGHSVAADHLEDESP